MPKMKQKQIHKTKEQLIKEAENKKEIARKRDIIVDRFYPALIKATISVDEAKALLQAISSLMMEEVLKTMKERNFAEISNSIFEKICTDGERKEEITELLATLQPENLFVAREIIEGMGQAIGAMITTDMRERKLDTLKTNWESYLN